MKKEKMETRRVKRIKGFLKSYKPVLIVLIILLVVVMSYSNYLLKSTKVYTFSGKGDYVKINNGVVSLNYDVNLLNGSDITYTKEKDIVVVDYKIGYYVKDGDNLLSLLVVEDADKEGLSLKKVLEGTNTFNLNELNSNHKFFSKEKIELLNNGLYFTIEAKDKKGKEIKDITKLDLIKLTK